MIDTKGADNLLKAIEALELQIKKLLSNLSSLKITDLVQLESGLDFYTSLIELGYEDRVNEFLSEYDEIIKQSLIKAKDEGITGVFKKSFNDIEAIKSIDKSILLGKAKDYSDRLERELLIGYATGLKPKEMASNLDGITLTGSQTNAMLNTYLADVSRVTSAKIYADEPELRFKYLGPVVEHSSEECRWLILNQRKEGYTKAEIDAGIETPFIYKSGELQGQRKKIYWSGRKPNFNCLHEWVQI